MAGLRRSLRLQYVKKSVNNPSTFAGECTPAPPLTWSTRFAAGSTAYLQLGPLPGSLRGPHPAPQPGLKQGRRREYQCFGATADLETFEALGDCRTFRRQELTEIGAHTTTNLSNQRAVTCTLHEKEGARASCQHVTLRNCRGLPASTTTVKNGNDLLEEPAQAFTQWARPGPCSNRLHHGSTATARHPGRAAVGWRPQQKAFQTECACPCCILYTHRRAAKRPLAASLPATPALGHLHS